MFFCTAAAKLPDNIYVHLPRFETFMKNGTHLVKYRHKMLSVVMLLTIWNVRKAAW
jgi:hypothetical protein